MSLFTDRILARLRVLGGGSWRTSCVAGAPLPEGERCAALDCDSRALSDLRVGDAGIVSCLQAPASREGRKLLAMGVLPGVQLHLVQRYPAFVFRLGHAEFAIDAGMASHVRVYVDGDVRRAG